MKRVLKQADIDKVRELIGENAFNLLISKYKGCALYVPSRFRLASKHIKLLINVIGEEKTNILVTNIGYHNIYFRTNRGEVVENIHAQIANGYKGQLISDYAVEHNVSKPTMYNILKKYGKIPRRLSAIKVKN